MEDTLRVNKLGEDFNSFCLNPCFNGRYSQSIIEDSEANPWS